jgi:hypothetical protein
VQNETRVDHTRNQLYQQQPYWHDERPKSRIPPWDWQGPFPIWELRMSKTPNGSRNLPNSATGHSKTCISVDYWIYILTASSTLIALQLLDTSSPKATNSVFLKMALSNLVSYACENASPKLWFAPRGTAKAVSQSIPLSAFQYRCHPRETETSEKVNDYFLQNWPFGDEKAKRKFVAAAFSQVTCLYFPLSFNDRIEHACKLLTILFLIDGES